LNLFFDYPGPKLSPNCFVCYICHRFFDFCGICGKQFVKNKVYGVILKFAFVVCRSSQKPNIYLQKLKV